MAIRLSSLGLIHLVLNETCDEIVRSPLLFEEGALVAPELHWGQEEEFDHNPTPVSG